MQLWDFVVVTDPATRQSLAEAVPFADKAQVCIFICYNTRFSEGSYANIQSASAAVMNMLLRAHSLGLGGLLAGHDPRPPEAAPDAGPAQGRRRPLHHPLRLPGGDARGPGPARPFAPGALAEVPPQADPPFLARPAGLAPRPDRRLPAGADPGRPQVQQADRAPSTTPCGATWATPCAGSARTGPRRRVLDLLPCTGLYLEAIAEEVPRPSCTSSSWASRWPASPRPACPARRPSTPTRGQIDLPGRLRRRRDLRLPPGEPAPGGAGDAAARDAPGAQAGRGLDRGPRQPRRRTSRPCARPARPSAGATCSTPWPPIPASGRSCPSGRARSMPWPAQTGFRVEHAHTRLPAAPRGRGAPPGALVQERRRAAAVPRGRGLPGHPPAARRPRARRARSAS